MGVSRLFERKVNRIFFVRFFICITLLYSCNTESSSSLSETKSNNLDSQIDDQVIFLMKYPDLTNLGNLNGRIKNNSLGYVDALIDRVDDVNYFITILPNSDPRMSTVRTKELRVGYLTSSVLVKIIEGHDLEYRDFHLGNAVREVDSLKLEKQVASMKHVFEAWRIETKQSNFLEAQLVWKEKYQDRLDSLFKLVLISKK